MPVTDLFEEYRNDIRWIKNFYLPLRLTALDFFFGVSINESAREAFQEEETRLFNIVLNKKKNNQELKFEEFAEMLKFDFNSYVFALSVDFFLLPDPKKIFKEKISKFFELVKSFTNVEYINIDMDYLEKYVNNSKIFKNVQFKISNDFKQATKFKKTGKERIKSLQSNLGSFKKKYSKTHPFKVGFVTNENDLDNNIEILDVFIKFVISCGIPKLYTKDQEKVKKFLDIDFISTMINEITENWAKKRVFHESLNKGVFPGESMGIVDQTEFYNVHKLLPLVYGPTSLNFSYFSNFYLFY